MDSNQAYRALDVPASLLELRRELDGIDAEIVRLIAARLTTVTEIADAKQKGTASLRDEKRERLVLNQVEELAIDLGISASFIRGVFQSIIEHSVCLQAQRLDDGDPGGLSSVSPSSIRYFE